MKKLSVLLLFILSLKTCETSNPLPSKQEYERYLDQILLAFKDDKTKEILKNATPEQMEKGLIEKTLRKLHPDIRSKLDEIKRNIINEYKQKLRKAKMDDKIPDEMYQFQDADLIHLIKERHDRLAAMDEQRKKQFLKYEMEKELKHRMALRAMNEYDRKVQVALDEQNKKRMSEAEKNVKHPGNKQQLEDVWERDGFEKESFNAKTFFKLHDTDGDGFFNDFELMALFTAEVEALFQGYDEEEIDEEEKMEELEMMAEHVKEHIDTNEDGMVHIEEFIKYTQRDDFDHEDPFKAVFSGSEYDFSDDTLDKYENEMDDEEMEWLRQEADEERKMNEEKIKKMEDEAAKEETQQDDKLKNLMLNENIKKAIEEANKFRKLEAAKKLVQDAQVEEKVQQEEPKRNDETAEQQRIQAEQQRIQGEQQRIQAEQQSIKAEQQQILAEQTEQQRAQNEQAAQQKQQAEQAAQAEHQRIQAEHQRLQAEQAAQAEQQRLQAEQSAQDIHQRVQGEHQRIQAGNAELAEQKRVQDEQHREQAEQLKQQEEHKLELEAQLKQLEEQKQEIEQNVQQPPQDH